MINDIPRVNKDNFVNLVKKKDNFVKLYTHSFIY